MIRVFFQGGLGNQMFQYAAARCLAEQLDTEILCDLSWYFNPRNWAFRVPEFGVEFSKTKSFVSCCTNRILGKPLFELMGRGPIYKEPRRTFDPEFFNVPDGSSMIGYFQSEKYFKPIEQIVRDVFSFKQVTARSAVLEWETRIADSNTVAVHVRRGDYLRLDGFKVCSEAYYRRAIEWMKQRVESPVFCFFSDDLDWCRKVFAGEDAVYCDATGPQESPINDLRLIAACRHHILSNSSFSWWGAWLGKSAYQIVVVPHIWRTSSKIAFDIYCKDWVRLRGEGPLEVSS
jgi:hypothetical protein